MGCEPTDDADAGESDDERSGAAGRDRWLPPRVERAVFVTGFGAVVVWAVVGTWAAFRGLDLFDEAWYLVTYRDAKASDPLVTAAPFLIRPVYDVLSGSVVALRVVKLGAWLVLGAGLGTSLARWINVTPGLSRVNPMTLGALLATSGMAMYAVYPQTPSYNDLSIGLTLALLALAFRLASTGPDPRQVALLGAAGAGMAVLLGLTKATSAVVAVVAAVVVLLAASSTDHPWFRCARQFVAGSFAGAALTALAVHLLIVDLVSFGEATRWTVDVIQRTAVPWDRVWQREQNTLRGHRRRLREDLGPSAIAVVLSLPLYMMRRRAWARVVLVVGVVLFAIGVIADGYYRGGYLHLASQPVAMSAVAIAALALGGAALGDRRGVPRRVGIVLVVLGVLPYWQGLGSNVPYMWLALGSSATWLMLCVVVCCAQPSGDRRAVAFVAVAVVWCLGTTTAWTGLINYPTRVWTPLTGQTDDATGYGLDGLLVDPDTARHMAELEVLVDGQRNGQERPTLIGLTDLPAAVVITDSRTLVGGWFFDSSLDRTAAVIGRECESQAWRERDADPLLLVRDFELSEELIALMQQCGIDFPDGYEPVGTSDQPMGYYPFAPRVTLWAPVLSAGEASP